MHLAGRAMAWAGAPGCLWWSGLVLWGPWSLSELDMAWACGHSLGRLPAPLGGSSGGSWGGGRTHHSRSGSTHSNSHRETGCPWKAFHLGSDARGSGEDRDRAQ